MFAALNKKGKAVSSWLSMLQGVKENGPEKGRGFHLK